MDVLDDIVMIHSKMSCRKDIFKKIFDCTECFWDKKYKSDDILGFLTRGHYSEVDMYYALKINAYWG